MNLLYLILTALALFVVFRLLYRLLPALLRGKPIQTRLLRILPVVELLAWLLISFWGIYLLFGGQAHYAWVVSGMALVVVLALGWYVFRDYLSGVLLRADTGFAVGQHIRTHFAEGKIARLGYRHLVLLNQEGEEVRIPYSRFKDEVIIIPAGEESRPPHHFRISLPDGADPDTIRQKLFSRMMAMPWVSEPAPEISFHKDEEGRDCLHISYHTHTPLASMKVEDLVKKHLAGADEEAKQV